MNTDNMNNNSNYDNAEFNYDDYNQENEKTSYNGNNGGSDNKNANKKYIILSILLLIVLGVIAFFLIKDKHSNNNDNPYTNITYTANENSDVKKTSLVLKVKKLSLETGETQKLEVNVLNGGTGGVLTFSSYNSGVASVDNNGVIKALKVGTSQIVITYTNGSYVATTSCDLTVVKSTVTPADETKPVINYVMTGGTDGVVTNKDVSLKIVVTDNVKVDSIKYAINCDSNCNYKSISNNKEIVFNDSMLTDNKGTFVVTIVASDSSKNTVTKKVTVKIDKTILSCTITTPSGYDANKVLTINSSKSDVTYSWDGFTFNNTNTKKIASAGTIKGYVKDSYGTKSCTITINSQTEYRTKTCNKKVYSAWETTSPSEEGYVGTCNAYTYEQSRVICGESYRASCSDGQTYTANSPQNAASACGLYCKTSCAVQVYRKKQYRSCSCASWSDWSVWTTTAESGNICNKEVEMRTAYGK